MKKLSLAVAAVALAATAFATAPAMAAHAVVHGAYPLYVPEPGLADPGYDGNYGGDYGGFYGDPLGRYYDPAGAIPDSTYHGPKAVDLVLARTLDRTGDTILTHMLKCQAAYATYSAASNTYFARDGQPMTCYR